MRLLRLAAAVIFAAVLAVSVLFRVSDKADRERPVLTVDTQEISAPCSVTEKQLLAHVKAQDKKSGDLTDRVFVENISQFVEEGLSVVTFCVWDDDNNVAKATCRLRYTDYEKPELILSDGLVFADDRAVSIAGCARVTDKFEGDITHKLSATVEESESGGEVPVMFKVSTDKGYVYKWKVNICRVDPYSIDQNYSIKLKNHLLELSVGDKKPDFLSLVKGVTYLGENMKLGRDSLVVRDGGLNLQKEGVYDVWFELYSGSGSGRKRLTRERMIVICEDKNK